MAATLNQKGITRLLASAPVVGHQLDRAREVVEEIVRISPRRTGAYARSVRVGEPHVDLEAVVVPIETTDPFWHLVEYGSVNNEPYAPLRRAVVNLGLTLKELPKP